jgi:hypothetical protein
VHDARSVGAGKGQNVGMVHGSYCRREGAKVLHRGPGHAQSKVKTAVTFCQIC